MIRCITRLENRKGFAPLIYELKLRNPNYCKNIFKNSPNLTKSHKISSFLPRITQIT